MTTRNLSAFRQSADPWGPTSYLLPDISPRASSIGHSLVGPGLTIQKPRHFRNPVGELAGGQDTAGFQSHGGFCRWCNCTLWSSRKPPVWLPQSGRMMTPCAVVIPSKLPCSIFGSKQCCLMPTLALISACPSAMRYSSMGLMLCWAEVFWSSSLSMPAYL